MFSNVHRIRYNTRPCRIMTYNILTDRIAMSTRHNYCKMEYRKWFYRFPRLLAQIQAYEPHIIGLQETTPTSYEHSLRNSFIGYESIHASRVTVGTMICDISFIGCDISV